MAPALIVLLPLLGAIVPPLAIRAGRNACAAASAGITALTLLTLLSQATEVYAGRLVGWSIPWIPQLGLSLSFFIDGLGLFFAALILGMGLLIVLYARFYLAASDPMGRFYAFLLLFQGAMLGIVLSDNVLLMLVFWELTSLSSFLLIGYWSHLPESRQGARMALVVTGGGGLALIAGMLLLGHAADSYELLDIIERSEQVRSSPHCIPALALILVGAFTKSAQFPFHFWLPHAMAAPTPVSAYLHSATMVKAGVFLLARLWPVFSGTDVWFFTVSLVGLLTMVIAAWIALFKDDLKLVLAFSTVSHLGLITMLLGLGSAMAAVTAVLHTLNHAVFKAALFMGAGIIHHEAGTRDISRLGGLGRSMPITAAIMLFAAAAMAGVPLLNGFVSKEMMLEQVSGTVYAGLPWLFPLIAGLAALLSAAYSARLAYCVFLAPRKQGLAVFPHDPVVGMWLPAALLIGPVVVLGVIPELAQVVVERTAAAVIGAPPPPFHLALWHGFTPALAMSVTALVGGVCVLNAYGRLEHLRRRLLRPDAKEMFETTLRRGVASARALVAALHTGDLRRYALTSIATVAGAAMFGFWTGTHASGQRSSIALTLPVVVGFVVLLAACVLAAMRHHDRLLTLILTAAVGLIVSLAFLQFSAPDLALTQISVEVVTTVLLLLALNLLPKVSPGKTSRWLKLAHASFALAVGVSAAALAYMVLSRDFASISDYHLAQSKPGGGGANVVNVILVDFRGYDTFGEIIVLGIAGLAIVALLDSALQGAAGERLAAVRHGLRSPDAHPLILVVTTRVLLPLALTAGAYIFLRGHNAPGGGFIAGIVIAIALIMQYMASGYAWASERARLGPQSMIGGGIMLAGATGLAAWLFGRPFLTSAHRHVHLPLIGEIELASAVAFDLGVFLTVVGTVLVALATISRVEERARVQPQPASTASPTTAQEEVSRERVRSSSLSEEKV
jgi:multicomponent K+:H+ antiporter subunit A